ncbi:hypothetical protein LTR85_006872 [Meristemomyces frigidus]|nr:hypothetical protein LTR85_006872 [Meristemomyces frigidus]
MTETVDFWTALLTGNLQAKHIEASDSDGEASPTLIDEEILNAPRRKSARDDLAHQIAVRLHPGHEQDSLGPIIQYEKDIVMLRALVFEQRRTAVASATERNARSDWVNRISKQGPWDEAKEPFTTGAEPYYDTELIEFEKGVLYSDGRVDLCKMVTGPRNIGDLMESLRTNNFSKHFLLGNNIVGPTGAKAIASFIDDYPNRFETWYLAGNCIDAAGFSLLVNSLANTKAVTNVWLKRNPLGPSAAADVVRLITQTPYLRTLDLDQTQLGDAGVAEVFSSLADIAKPLALRHLYLNATGIGEKACVQIARYLASPYCALHSLYMSNNPVGDAGAAALAEGLATNDSLKRLSMQSCGFKDIRTLLEAGNSLEMLDVGQSYATDDLGMRFNWLTDTNVPALVNLISTSTNLKYLNLSYSPIPQDQLNKVLEAAASSTSLLWFDAKPLVKGGKDFTSVKADQESVRLWKLLRQRLHDNVGKQYGVDYDRFNAEHKRFLVSPKDVRLIDSVYRNRDAGLARRGLKKLDKWWEEGDETLRQVQDGTFV